MADFIEREAALKFKLTANLRREKITIAQAVADAIAAYIEAIPAADVVPVRHGRWIVDDITGIVKCSECNNDAPLDTTGGGQWCSPFCQSCGARMDGDGE